ncbi:MAG TPA: helix-turn-helix domain-containing protein [Mycobacteriales bacterium]|nr:helix-turn-helix domain-containing protein [Mycobacteriales bacterium]
MTSVAPIEPGPDWAGRELARRVGRPENVLGSRHAPLNRFAAGLRRLRATAGNPGYRELSRRADYSATTLSQAASGARLPSLAVTLAFVRACGGDETLWAARWLQVARESMRLPATPRRPVA